MADFPLNSACPQIISTGSKWSYGEQIRVFNTGTPASATWPSANLGIFVPVVIPAPFLVKSFFSLNGATAAGNIDMGLFGIDGSLIVSKGTTAQAGTATLQILTVTNTLVPAGRYYLAMSASSTSTTVLRHATGVAGQQLAGVVQAASQLPLATGATFATPANTFVPWFGVASITTY